MKVSTTKAQVGADFIPGKIIKLKLKLILRFQFSVEIFLGSMFRSSVTWCEQRKYHIKKYIQKRKTNLPLLYPPTQTFLCVKEKKAKRKHMKIKVTRIDRLHMSKVQHNLQSYPVNLALNVSSMTLLFISSRIILDNGNYSEFRETSFQTRH